MSSLNKVALIGNLGRDPEIRSTQAGDEVATLSLATSETWRDKATGERKERTEWHRVVIFNEGLVKVAKQYLHKGSKLYVEGQLHTRKWTDRDGVERYSTEVVLQRYRGELVMLDTRRDGCPQGPDDYGTTRATTAPAHGPGADPGALDDEIPF